MVRHNVLRPARVRWEARYACMLLMSFAGELAEKLGSERTYSPPIRCSRFDKWCLDNCKTKIVHEEWEVNAVANEERFSLRSLHAIGSAFTQGTSFSPVANGLAQVGRRSWSGWGG